ncbi:hypothetical protein FISHEDRAFT_12499, partial [Fistulina hepatica ATCC 64428]
MPYRSISSDIKQKALELVSDGWHIQDVCSVLGMCPRSVERWQANFDEQGTVNPAHPTRGRRRLLSPDIMHALNELIHENPTMYLDEI